MLRCVNVKPTTAKKEVLKRRKFIISCSQIKNNRLKTLKPEIRVSTTDTFNSCLNEIVSYCASVTNRNRLMLYSSNSFFFSEIRNTQIHYVSKIPIGLLFYVCFI
jgi:hypothetical protein